MDDFEFDKRGPITKNDVARMILDFSQELGEWKNFSTPESAIQYLSSRNPKYGALSMERKIDLFIDALGDLSQQETRYTGGSGAGMGKFGRLLMTAVGVFSKAVDVIRDPSKIVNVAQEFLGPALQQLTSSHPNNPPSAQSTSSGLVGVPVPT
jgi:hypothetical protein